MRRLTPASSSIASRKSGNTLWPTHCAEPWVKLAGVCLRSCLACRVTGCWGSSGLLVGHMRVGQLTKECLPGCRPSADGDLAHASPGTMDEGGLKQPAYLNFELSLLGPPASNEMKVRLLASPCAPPLSCTERCPSRMQQCYPCPFVPS